MTARLNIASGPNTDVLTLALAPVPAPLAATEVAEFDLAAVGFNEAQVHKLWLDILLVNPQMNAVRLRDVILSRHRRAEM